LCNSALAQNNAPAATRKSAIKKEPLRKQSSPAPTKTENKSLRLFPTYEPARVAPVPLQSAPEVENPSNMSNRIFGTTLNNMEYDYLDKFHFGFAFSLIALDYRIISSKNASGSLNVSDFANAYVNLSAITPAFGVSGMLDIHINQFFSFRIQIGPILGSKDLTFWGVADSSYHTMRLESIIVEAPLLLKYKALRTSNARPYIIAGLTPSLNVAAMGKFNEEKGIYLAVKPFDLHFNIGIGGDFYLNNFKIGVEAKYTTGFINNVTKDVLQGYEGYPAAIERAVAHSFVLTVLFDG
jgi:hypothetical protein